MATISLYPNGTDVRIISAFINGLHGFMRLEFQPENNMSGTVKLHTDLD